MRGHGDCTVRSDGRLNPKSRWLGRPSAPHGWGSARRPAGSDHVPTGSHETVNTHPKNEDAADIPCELRVVKGPSYLLFSH